MADWWPSCSTSQHDCITDMDKMVIVGDNSFGEQKSRHRCRRKKHDVRMLDA